MMAKSQQEGAPVTLFVNRWEQASRKIEQLAEEFPAGKFEWRPREGVRTCGEVIRHVAFWNRYVADSLRGKQTDESLNELPVSEYQTKAKMLKALRQSAEEAAGALRERHGSVDEKAAELVVTFIEHTSEHYGQLAAYARLLDIVPPASRG